MYYVYILLSILDKHYYVGYTHDLKKRLIEHKEGKVLSTTRRRPLTLVYYEASLDKRDALYREKYLKTAWGKRYIKNRINYYLTG
jgi:putative endonuclease